MQLVEDSEVFQDGAIGESLSGGKLNTYKELCSLANEMGQPDLIYKFMDLANYQASLNSKRGAAFGFSKIAKQAGDALQPHLRLLVPRLIRYQYDPDKNVQVGIHESFELKKYLLGSSSTKFSNFCIILINWRQVLTSHSKLWMPPQYCYVVFFSFLFFFFWFDYFDELWKQCLPSLDF